MTNIKVTKSAPPETKEILAEAIVRIGDGFNSLLKSGLNREAVVVLLHAKTAVNKKDIVAVLDGLTRLKGWYCR